MRKINRNTPQPSSQDRKRNTVAEWAVTILFLLFGTTTICQAFVIPTGSMEDTLRVGDHLLVDKLAYSTAEPLMRHLLPYETPRHGDIIVFRYPPDLRLTLVKRLIGMPGDRIRIANGVVYRNGKPLNEPYVFHKYDYNPEFDYFPWQCCRPVKEPAALSSQREMLQSAMTSSGEILIPPDMYFGMGDNRDNSSDSRYWGFIPRDNIVGRPVLVYWSYRASTEDLSGESVNSVLNHSLDLVQHFFTRTRWERTLMPVRGFPDSELPDHPLPIRRGLQNP